MKVVFYAGKENSSAAEERVSEDPVGRQSVYIRDAVSLGLDEDGTYVLIDGTEEACEIARERLEGIAEEVTGDDREDVISRIEEQEDSVAEGVGGLFG